MNHTNTLQILAKPQPELVERILRVVRHRGFTLNSLNMVQEEHQLLLTLSVKSERSIELLWPQINKLVDVIDVVIAPQRQAIA